MARKDWFGIAYVSIWVVLWGSIGSIIDLPLLNSNIYNAGSLGQVTTFIITAILSIGIGILVYPKAINNKLISSIIKPDESE